MASHVDLVENRWSAGWQERVGTVFLDAGHVQVRTEDHHYREVVLGSLPELMAESASKFLQALPGHFHSDYFFATEPHDEADCPFAAGDRIAMEQASSTQQASSPTGKIAAGSGW